MHFFSLHPKLLPVAIVLAIAGFAGAGLAQDTEAPITAETLLSTQTTVIGQPFDYPTETPAEISASIVTIAPGAETGWHIHPVPLFGYMLEGTLTVDYGSRGTRTYESGDSLVEAWNWPHNGINHGDVPVQVMVVYAGAEGLPTAVPTDGPDE